MVEPRATVEFYGFSLHHVLGGRVRCDPHKEGAAGGITSLGVVCLHRGTNDCP